MSSNHEERLLTVYADVHYYFSTPTPRPLSHRFDKGSYVYLYRNANGEGGRIEIANNVGKPEQDAFTGSLDSSTIRKSHKHPTLCTLTVDGYLDQPLAPAPPIKYPEHHWRLPNTDPRNEGKYLFRLHTLDIYFWTAEDAHSFIAAAGNIIQHEQLEILDAPPDPTPDPIPNPNPHEPAMSPVVQQLENVAIQDPAYHNGQTRNSRAAMQSVSTPSITSGRQGEAGGPESRVENPEAYKPLAYNPAAPAAPEPIRHREKTPPPLEAESGTGLAAAAYHDQAQMVPPSSSQRHSSMSNHSYGHPQPSEGYMTSHQDRMRTPSFASASPSTRYATSSPLMQGHRTSSISSTPTQGIGPSVGPYSHIPSFAAPPHIAASTPIAHSGPSGNTFSPSPQDPNAHLYSGAGKPLDTPTTQILGDSYLSGPPQPLQHLQPQYADYLASHPPESKKPVGGYSDYKYNQAQHHHGHHHSQENAYDVHSQVYRPTKEEASKVKHHKVPEVSKIDKGVNRFFKKLEKKIG